MNCPSCAIEMQKGYVNDHTQPIQWIPEGQDPSFWRGRPAKNAIVIGDGDVWYGYRADAYYCPNCKFVVIPVK